MLEKALISKYVHDIDLTDYASHCFTTHSITNEIHEFDKLMFFGPMPADIKKLAGSIKMNKLGYLIATDVYLDEFGSIYSANEIDDLETNCEVVNGVGCFLTQPGDTVYGHWIFHHLPRLWFCSRSLNGVKFKVLLHFRARHMVSIFKPVLEMMDGFDGVVYLDAMPSKVECLVYCDQLTKGNRIVKSSYAAFRGWFLDIYFKKNASCSSDFSPEKVYFTRSNWKLQQRNLINSDEVEDYFRQKGFTVVSPESLSFLELVCFLRNTKVIAGERGSALHASAFSPTVETVVVMAYSHDKNGMWPGQAGIGTACGQSTLFIFGDGVSTGETNNDYDYTISLSDLGELITHI